MNTQGFISTDDPRSEAMKISMAEHFGEFEYEYRKDPHTDAEVVYEDDQVIDCIEIGVKPENAAEPAREWMEQNNRQ